MVIKQEHNKETYEFILSRINEYNESRSLFLKFFRLGKKTYTELESSYDELIWEIKPHGSYQYNTYSCDAAGRKISHTEKSLTHPILSATNKVTGEVHIITEMPQRGKCRLLHGSTENNYIYKGRQLYHWLILY